jgi:hypothetical protein
MKLLGCVLTRAFLPLAVSGFLFTNSASASILLPGSTGQAPDILSLAGLTFVSSVSGSASSLTFNATYTAAVYSGVNNVCATANCLTFLYQYDDVSAVPTFTGIIESINASSFGNAATTFMTDVGYATAPPASNPAGFVAGTATPFTVDRSSAGPGSVITWDYTGPGGANELTPGHLTNVLVIETNATTSVSGLTSAQDGATSTQIAFGATTPTVSPEPSTLMLFGSVLVGLSLLRKRVRS